MNWMQKDLFRLLEKLALLSGVGDRHNEESMASKAVEVERARLARWCSVCEVRV